MTGSLAGTPWEAEASAQCVCVCVGGGKAGGGVQRQWLEPGFNHQTHIHLSPV